MTRPSTYRRHRSGWLAALIALLLAAPAASPWPLLPEASAASNIDLAVETSVDSTFAAADAVVVLSITLSNSGGTGASGVVVEIEYTAALAYVDHEGGSFDPATGWWTVDALGSGSSETLDLSLQVAGSGTIPYSARVLIVDQVDDPDSVQGNRDEFEDDQSSGSVMTPPCSVDDHDLWLEPVAAVLVALPIEDGVCLDYDPNRSSSNPGGYGARLVTVQSSPSYPDIDLGMVMVHEACHSHQSLIGGGSRDDWWATAEGQRFLALTGTSPSTPTDAGYTNPYEDSAQNCAIWYDAFHNFDGPSSGGPGTGREQWASEYLPRPIVTRHGGGNRYGTAARVVAERWLGGPDPNPPNGVYIATGTNFPDALAGAGRGSPLVLVSRSGVPSETAALLQELDPDYIWILGGTSAVSTSIRNTLATYGAEISRFSGYNRYATAVMLNHWQPDGAGGTVFIATGTGFADALAGAAAAAAVGGSILLTAPTYLPSVVRDELLRQQPDQIVVLGGTSAVSNSVFSALQALGDVERISGSNRYDTAVKISQFAFDFAPTVYIATGTSFPDALAGASAAGSRGAPVLLTPPGNLPQIVADEIARLGATEVVILGGPAAVSRTVQEQLLDLVG